MDTNVLWTWAKEARSLMRSVAREGCKGCKGMERGECVECIVAKLPDKALELDMFEQREKRLLREWRALVERVRAVGEVADKDVQAPFGMDARYFRKRMLRFGVLRLDGGVWRVTENN